jgi:hypothetical protein
VLVLIAADRFGGDLFGPPYFVFLILPFLGAALVAGLMQARERLPWGVFYLIWLAPMMSVWIVIVFVRASALFILDRAP